MNERTFKAKLRTIIKPYCYIQSMSSLATAGTPDLWLSATKDLWLEVKWDETTKGAIKPKLSALQVAWLNARAAEGRNVAVLVGTSPKEAILYTNGVFGAQTWTEHSNNRRPLPELVRQILEFIT